MSEQETQEETAEPELITVQIKARLPAELHRRVKMHAANHGQALAKVIADALDKGLPKYPGGGKKP